LRDLVRTLEWLVWPLAAMVAVLMWLASGLISNHWLHPEHLSREQTAHAVAIMGLAVALQWPSGFYANGLSGLERQPVLNAINAGFATLRGAGVLAVLYWISPTIEAFMWWFAAMGACQSALSAIALWRALPRNGGRHARFHAHELRATGRFAGGLLAIMALATAVTQLDRIVLSAMRPLVELGYFSLALTVATGLARLIQPMFNALYPRYSKLVALGESNALTRLYHLSNQYMAVVVASTSVVLAIFSKDVVYLWTGDADTAAKVAAPLSILAVGTALNGLLNLPYALQLAHGWTRLTVMLNLAALALGIPFCIWAVGLYGINGAALVWLGINICFVAVGLPLMHRRLLRGELAAWCAKDVIPPFIGAAVIGAAAKLLLPEMARNTLGVLQLGMASAACLSAAALASPGVRAAIRRKLEEPQARR
jgi:O-antigen/teichoic acid export membrane protein